jgi:hypothetical protein
MRTFVALLLVVALPGVSLAHSGGTDAYGCHHDRKNGGYHCHRSGQVAQAPKALKPLKAPKANDAPKASQGATTTGGR